jgi:ElaB/YqjD/DUF883 family membrane-anchored ribosome-binding protein
VDVRDSVTVLARFDMTTQQASAQVGEFHHDLRDVPGMDSIRRRAERTRDAISDSIDDGIHQARRALTHGRQAAEDATDLVRLRVRRDPVRALGLALAVGVLSGVLIAQLLPRRSRQRS